MSYVSHPDPVFRGMAASCLIEIPEALDRAAASLIERLELEEDEEIAEAVIVATRPP